MTRIQKCLDQTQLESFVRSYSFVRLRKKIEMLFAHLKRILKLDRLRLRGPTRRA